jgi:cytochrome c oxidase subunit II
MSTSPPPAEPASEPRHGRRIALIWAVLAVVLTPIVAIVLGPHLPPGRGSAQASSQTDTNIVLTSMVTPVVLFLLVYFTYALINFRQRDSVLRDGPPIRGHSGIQTIWVASTATIVLFLAGYGTFVLLGPSHGAGGGQGPVPLSRPSGAPLQVQVIGQQWAFTYRFPQYGGVETMHLELPVNRTVQFNVTSTDVIHSFWAIELGVKADAVPGANNVAYVVPKRVMTFQIRCAELCGLFHGQMFDYGHVVSDAAFATWIRGQVAANASITRYLPPYAPFYIPEPTRRAG